MPRRLSIGQVRASVMLIAAVAAFLANLGSVLLPSHHSAEDINVRSAFSTGPGRSGVAGVWWRRFLPDGSGKVYDPGRQRILIGVCPSNAISIVWQSLHTLLEAAPAGVNVEEVAGDVSAAVSPCQACIHVHAGKWDRASGRWTAHMKVGATTLLEVEAIAAEVRSFLHRRVEHYPCHTGS